MNGQEQISMNHASQAQKLHRIQPFTMPVVFIDREWAFGGHLIHQQWYITERTCTPHRSEDPMVTINAYEEDLLSFFGFESFWDTTKSLMKEKY